MQILGRFSPQVEIYSIDECFLDFTALPFDLTPYALGIARTVKQWTGIPISIGIAPGKTLAKLANRLAKKGQSPAGPVLDWTVFPSPDAVLATIPVEDIWGIASRSGAKLRKLGIADALALRNADTRQIRAAFGVVMEQIVRELQGVSCLPLETVPPPSPTSRRGQPKSCGRKNSVPGRCACSFTPAPSTPRNPATPMR
jgi:DNA polymerase V